MGPWLFRPSSQNSSTPIPENLPDRQRQILAALDNAMEEFSAATEEFLDPELVIVDPRWLRIVKIARNAYGSLAV